MASSYRDGDGGAHVGGSEAVRFSDTTTGYEALPVMSGIKEKGFPSSSLASSVSTPLVSFPGNPSVAAFPVARHRSQGPHWLPITKEEPAVMAEDDGEESDAEALSALAKPQGKEKAALSVSMWKMMNKSSDSTTMQEISRAAEECSPDMPHEVVLNDEAPLHYAASAAARARSNFPATARHGSDDSQGVPDDGRSNAMAIDDENRAAIAATSIAEVARAQTELMERSKPAVLDMLRKRRLKKEKNWHAEDERNDELLLTTGNVGNSEALKTVESFETGSEEKKTLSVLSQQLSAVGHNNMGSSVVGVKSWTERVEAVRLHKFDLEGNVLGIDEADDTSSAVTLSEKSISECNYLQSEGNPAVKGYSLKEATDLIWSTFPGHRVFALQLIAAVLNKAIAGIQTQCLCFPFRPSKVEEHNEVDWQAVWAYALGPEPQLVLTLRLALDDKDTTVVVACSKALQAILTCSANEAVSNLHEAFWPGDISTFMAPIFRRHSKHSEGFLGGGHWKYNVKTNEMFPFSERVSSKVDGGKDEETVGHDTTVAIKDVAAGFIHMGILPRIRFILEVEKITGANEPLLSVVVALARHSPGAADAVMKCPRLMDSIIQQFFLMDEELDAEVDALRPAHTKAIELLKVLLQASRMNCIRFAESGALQVAQCELYRQGYPMQLHPRLGEECFEGVRSTIIASLRLWRVCIHYQMGISLFSDIYPALCFWLAPLSSEEIASNKKEDALCLAQESYILLESLAQTLPRLHSQEGGMSDTETEEIIHINWTWQVAIPVVETALGWLSTESVSAVTNELVIAAHGDEQSLTTGDGSRAKLVGTLASLFHFLATVSEKIGNENEEGRNTVSRIPWLPTFIPHLGLLLATNGVLNYGSLASVGSEKSTLFASLCAIRHRGDYEMSLAATSCFHGLVRLLNILDQLIGSAKPESGLQTYMGDNFEGHNVLDRGLVASGAIELRGLLALVGREVIMNGHVLQSSEANGRGGPAPGLGLGWGSVGGGAWSKGVLVARASARLVAELLEILPPSHGSFFQALDCEMGREEVLASDFMWRISCWFGIIAIADPENGDLVEQACLKSLLHPDMLEFLFQNMEILLKSWDESEGSSDWMKGLTLSSSLDPQLVSKLLMKDFRDTWTSTKLSKASKRETDINPKVSKRGKSTFGSLRLATVCEEEGTDVCSTMDSLVREWARQRLPLPSHWLLSPMATNISHFLDGSQGIEVLTGHKVSVAVQEKLEMEEVVKAGISWLLSLEVLSETMEESESNFIVTIPLIRKLHALSTVFVLADDFFLHEDVHKMVGTLQEFYGHQLDNWPIKKHLETSEFRSDMASCLDESPSSMPLDFICCIDGNYTTFAETLAEQFGASSYGDLVFGRQVAIYLRQGVPDSVRLAIWHQLAEVQVLKLLPPLTQCCGQQWGYLYPFETNNQMIEAYVSAWTSGAFETAVVGGSMSFALALHHIFGYIFIAGNVVKEKLALNKVITTLVQSSTQRVQQQAMLMQLLEYQPPSPRKEMAELSSEEFDNRVQLLLTACEGDLSLVAQDRHNKQRSGKTHMWVVADTFNRCKQQPTTVTFHRNCTLNPHDMCGLPPREMAAVKPTSGTTASEKHAVAIPYFHGNLDPHGCKLLLCYITAHCLYNSIFQKLCLYTKRDMMGDAWKKTTDRLKSFSIHKQNVLAAFGLTAFKLLATSLQYAFVDYLPCALGLDACLYMKKLK